MRFTRVMSDEQLGQRTTSRWLSRAAGLFFEMAISYLQAGRAAGGRPRGGRYSSGNPAGGQGRPRRPIFGHYRGVAPYEISRGPRRIVCLTEEPTEILYALGEGDRVVGISAYTVRPPEARRDKPVVSAFIGGSVEKIARLAPDLVIGFSDIQANLARDLIAANLPVLIFNQRSLQEILDVIVAIGGLVGAFDRARDLAARYAAGLEATAARTAKRAHRPRVYFEEWPDPMLTGILWVSELIEIAGGTDVFAERARGRQGKDRRVTVAEVARAAPEVMIACWCGKPFDRQEVMRRLGPAGVPAVVSGRVHEMPPEIILQPGPACLTDGLARLEAILSAPPPRERGAP